jgi:hypothetical protein
MMQDGLDFVRRAWRGSGGARMPSGAFALRLGIVAILGLALPHVATRPAVGQSGAPVAAQPEEDRLSQAQLEQLLAPIALYPDDLLMQVLIASTYPLEIVQAKRWLGQGQNASLHGDALVQALNDQPWDPSVKSLVPFPDVLTLMNDQLDWTQQVGDAVLAQQQDALNAIQSLRARAQASGALQTGPQQTVTVTQNVTTAPQQGAALPPPAQTIAIAPTDPGQVFVPAYDPSVVYGSWPYPENPPFYYPPPVGWGVGNAILTGMAFAGSVAVVDSLWGWARPGWGRGDVDIDINRFNNININRDRITNNRWQHDLRHRHGVSYGNDRVRDRVGANRPAGGRDRAAAREQFRGRLQQAGHGGGGDRPNLAGRLPGGGDRPSLGGGGRDGPDLADRMAQRPRHRDRERPSIGGRDGNRPNLGDRAAQRPRDRDGPRPALGDRDGNRPSLADRRAQRPGHDGGGRLRQAAASRPAVQHRPSGRPQARPAATRQAPQGLRGVGNGHRERAAASRGRASRQGQPAARAQAHQRRAAATNRGGGRAAAHRGGGGGGRAARGGGRRHR